MEMTPTLLALLPGGTAYFDFKHHTSLLSICTRLKKKGMGTFKTAKEVDKIAVTRLSLPEAQDTTTEGLLKPLGELERAKTDLKWHDWSFDPAGDNYEVKLSLHSKGRGYVIKMPVGADLPVLIGKLIEFIDFKIGEIKKS